MITNTTRDPRECESGQTKNRLIVVKSSPKRRVFRGPRASAAMPDVRRPAAEDMLKPATRPAPAVEDRPSDAL